VHELRHKQYAASLHRQVRTLLKPNGVYLVCDHYCGEGGMKNDQLYQSLEEQRSSITSAGFQVAEVLIKGGRALYHAS
jgi:predicted methyltransferase